MNDYIKTMRQLIGHETLLTIGCGAIIEDDRGRILLQKRIDGDIWGIPGGILEIGETFEETVKREVFEETNLILNNMTLFGLYSGKNGFAEYSNGDKVFSVQIIFYSSDYKGTLQINDESSELHFLSRNEIPLNLNPHQSSFIKDWSNGIPTPVIK
ncbi:NUDIX hydrolase [Lysinibacillus sp. NPDC093190]|uniref:NUDIX hydrolase n=1 Tax=Lysinibacillus sp. NPDC093190 TaxID=3390575 RepID=UPI003D0301D0